MSGDLHNDFYLGFVMTEIQSSIGNDSRYEYRILVLSSRPDHMQKITQAALALRNEVVSVTTIRQGVEFLDTKDHVDVVVAEAFLQDESVFDFLKDLRSKPEHQDVPILLIAAEPTSLATKFLPSVAIMADVLGAYKFLCMPTLDTVQLMKEVGAVLPLREEPKKEQDPSGAY